MKLLVGIYQKKEQVEQYIVATGSKDASVTEVGPFPSRLDGVRWMEYLGEKIKNYEIASFPLESTDKEPWYGFAFAIKF